MSSRTGSRAGSRAGTHSRASDEDSKTAVRVDPNYDLIPPRFQRKIVTVSTPTTLTVDSPQSKKVFIFDRVFPEETDQRGVWQYVSDSVESFVQGYNVSILAYGQSGAGKSHTMGTGDPQDMESDTLGIIPRAAQALFERLEVASQKTASGSDHNMTTGLRIPTRHSTSPTSLLNSGNNPVKSWQLRATYVEIYNEQLRDLLLPDSIPPGSRPQVTIREDTRGKIILTGLRSVEINSIDDLMAALTFGSSIRQTDATLLNAQSSRSHAVFSLNLVMKHDCNPALARAASPKPDKRMSMPDDPSKLSGDNLSITINSKMHFVDLAGSERLKHTGAIGDRAKEGISINAGLASLGKVISQLSTRNPGAFVSYRDSKLTRLLQDSLGGNAITYMIACVTPVEFHLNETLNTVQYAQRARAIQSKPHIQQVTDDGDKNAVIERLKTEIAFLRDQVKSARDSANVAETEVARMSSVTPDTERLNGTLSRSRGERQNEREKELQNALLDAQESYEALSARHAKLMAEMSKATKAEAPTGDSNQDVSASDRVKLSHSFAESVEQVVLEYEKTIQSLETSLSQTRSSLSSVESNLLEKETKCAYIETINNQLQARIQKMAERDADTEQYVQALEARLDGHANGEEHHNTVINTLRRELARARENEASCEDYISTLEERLAEADQDAEMMQRELERLEQVIDRQRSLTRLDGLLTDLDSQGSSRPVLQSREGASGSETAAPGTVTAGSDGKQPTTPTSSADGLTPTTRSMAEPLTVVEEEPACGEETEAFPEYVEEQANNRQLAHKHSKANSMSSGRERPTSSDHDTYIAAQSQLVVQQLAAVSQELADLKAAHDTKVAECERLNLKYKEALRNIAEMQEAADDIRVAPATPLSDTGFRSLNNFSHKSRSSLTLPHGPRPLDVELSAAPTTPRTIRHTTSSISDTGIFYRDPREGHPRHAHSLSGSAIVRGSTSIQNLRNEHQQELARITRFYEQLQAEHQQTLHLVEQLRADLLTSRSPPTSVSSGSPTTASTPRGSLSGHTPAPSLTHKPKVLRRVTSLSLSNTDRAHRYLATLRNLASEELEGKPETLTAFEQSLDATMHELHVRMERIEALENDNFNLRKDVEAKATLVAGLTRERSSLSAAAPQVDLSFVSHLQQQLEASQARIKEMEESHRKDVKKLVDELASVNKLVEELRTGVQERDEKICTLERESKGWEEKHGIVAAALSDTEERLQSALAQLESALAGRVDMEKQQSSTATELDSNARQLETAQAELEELRVQYAELQSKHGQVTGSLDDHKSQLQSTLSDLEDALRRVAALERERDELANRDAAAELAKHADEVNALQRELAEHKQTIDEHRSIIDEHLKTIDKLEDDIEKAQEQAAANEKVDSNHAAQLEGMQRKVNALTADIEASKAVVVQREHELEKMQAAHAQEVEALEAKLTESDKEHNQLLNEKTTFYEKELKSLRADIEASQDELKRLVSDVSILLEVEIPDTASLRAQIETLAKSRLQLTEQIAELTRASEASAKEIASHSKRIEELAAEASSSDDKAKEMGLLVATHEEAISDLEAELEKKEKLIGQLEAENAKSARLVEELEDQLSSTYDEQTDRLSVAKGERARAGDEASAKINSLEKVIETYQARITLLESQLREANGHDRHSSGGSLAGTSTRKSTPPMSMLPSPPPAIPLPPLPTGVPPSTTGSPATHSRAGSEDRPGSHGQRVAADEQETRVRNIQKQLDAEKKLTATLEEALTELEEQGDKVKADLESWKKKAYQYEDELTKIKTEKEKQRVSMQAVEEERLARKQAEAARAQLEEKMNAINKKKKKSTLACF
ncbi:hypothetical protein KEM52_006415 [Ascosphaera acerosa]|nr:hypothetical protein KEM52_006415 [Ascosphaera acerosa]